MINVQNKEMLIGDPEEIALIQAYRAKQDQNRQWKLCFLHLLDVAHDYQAWLWEEGEGSTFSTFCDDFDYFGRYGDDPAPGMKRDTVYRIVDNLINCVWHEMGGRNE